MVRLAKEKKQLFTQLKKVIGSRFAKNEVSIIFDFIQHYYQDVAWEELDERELEDLYGAAVSHWNLVCSGPLNTTKINVYNPDFETHGWQSPNTVIEIATLDRPFLVNSLTMSLNANGLAYHLVIHPVLELCDDEQGFVSLAVDSKEKAPTALIHIEIDRQISEGDKLNLIKQQLLEVLDYSAAVSDDWRDCLKQLDDVANDLKTCSLKNKKEDISEAISFLKWIEDEHFLFLGCREYELDKDQGFKIIEGSGTGILRDELAIIPDPVEVGLSAEMKAFVTDPVPLIVTKATSKSIIHRPAYMDYIGVKKFNSKGLVVGEYRFLGLYTSAAYHTSVNQVPLLRKKIQHVFRNSGFKNDSHSGKALMNVLEGLPRDELFHSDNNELLNLSLGVLQLRDRQRIRLFARRDIYGQFISFLVYVPKDRYNTNVRKMMEKIICKSLAIKTVDFNVEFNESILARIHFTVHTASDWQGEFDVAEMENEFIEILRDWKEDLFSALKHHFGDAAGTELFNRYGEGFSAAYQENYPARFAVSDLEKITYLAEPNETVIQMSLYQPLESHGKGLQFKLINKGEPAPLSQTLPVLENMGVTVFDERPFKITEKQTETAYWIHDFGLIYKDDLPEVEVLKEKFQTVFEQVWSGHVENDGFNRLVIKAGLDWKKIMLLRAYYLYLRQAGGSFSQSYVEQTLDDNAVIAAHLVHLFELKFDPEVKGRAKKVERQEAVVVAEIEKVSSLDEDRILRCYLNLIQSTIRTSYYQANVDLTGVPYLAFKFDPTNITDLPSPRPAAEIFVYSPRVEGVHLRGGPIARGGLRWSDRREDYRTEILGLMKAQVSKNAVIVPTGAKGGFFVKSSLDGLSRDEMMKEVVECYSIFISALLDLTDNLKGQKTIGPKHVVCYDEPDPYLVVAADKGTATFSDIANSIAEDYDFWLGDAFASGGSVGYDHKKMGITAKGAWESVKRHFREMGVDTQKMPFNVVGIGDMGGDVFGNGMLLSEQIRLVAAFNHLHIFLDPTPDTAASYKERQRLFKLPRSNWADYEEKLISAGGGIYSRTDKSIALTPEVKQLLGIKASRLTPTELIKAILKAPVDLLWNGGIGTYVKSHSETHDQVGDRANDSLRIDGRDLRCKVVGEGGNLGFTQLGRIEYANQSGGRINTDSIDNAAGVDCSDHEVNIKILLNKVVEQGDMTKKQRDVLLAQMTDEVSALVLRNNYHQSQAISMVEKQAGTMIGVHERLINELSQYGRLDRVVEFLPNSDEIEERRLQGKGLSRPELAVIFAYSKLLLKEQLEGSVVLKNDGFKKELVEYFPLELSNKFKKVISEHRLGNAIIVNQLVNNMVNRLGPSLPFRMKDEVGASTEDIIKSFKIACDIYDVNSLWKAIEKLDNQVLPDVQINMLMKVRQLIERTMFWMQHNRSHVDSINKVINEFRESIGKVSVDIYKHLSVAEKESLDERTAELQVAGVPEKLAFKVSGLELEFNCLDIIAVQSILGQENKDVLPVYFAVNDHLQLNWLNNSISQLPRKNYWQSLARTALRNDLHAEIRTLLVTIFRLSEKKSIDFKGRVQCWCEDNAIEIERYLSLIAAVQAENTIEIEQLSVILKDLHAIVDKSKAKHKQVAA